MKEQKLDDLERMFRDGLQDLKAEPDAAVWLAIQDAMKKRRRFWFFWSLTGVVAIGLVATVLLQSDTQLASNPPSLPGDSGTDEVSRAATEGESGERTFGQSGEREKSSKLQVPSSKFQDPKSGSLNPEPRTLNPKSHPEQADGASGEADGASGEAEPSRHVEGPRRVEGPEPNELQPTAYSLRPTAGILNITSFRIPFIYKEQAADYLLFVSAYQPNGSKDHIKPINPKPDSTQKGSPFSLSFNPGLILPSIQSKGKTGLVNYEKKNEAAPGISMSLYLSYTFKENWMLRTGLDWSSYTVTGKHRYFGYTDTVEWIDRERNTGFQVIEKSRSWNFESQYQWVGIPIELGRRQNLGAGFSWDWTLGAGINYLYRYQNIAEGNNYLPGIDEGIKPLQFNLLAGFGVNYQVYGPWSSFINVQYRLQPNSLYESEFLREKHQILRFGIGLQYQFKWKGN